MQHLDRAVSAASADLPALEKCPSGLPGFDEITDGGLPRGRTTLLCGGAGCGKTLFGTQFLVRGAIDHGEPGVFMAFEETIEDLAKNVASLGFDLNDLVERGLLYLDHVRVERNEIEESGEYDLDGLFIRLELAMATVGAKRIVVDTLETLFGGLSNHAILRSELRRLFNWLKEKGVTAIITAERGEGALTRHGLEEYVSDCVILLDHRVSDQVSTRRLRVVKYRGSTHGTNEYPFLIDADGISVVPITGAVLQHEVSEERVSSGVARLDEMLAGGGYYRGSTVLVSGTAGAGKSSLAAHFANAVCAGGERCLYFSFEESPAQIKRNMGSIGLDLQAHEDTGLLRFAASRPTMYGLEMHLAVMHKAVSAFRPAAVIVDPIGNLMSVGSEMEAHLMLVRLIDFLKAQGVTALLTSLTDGGSALERTEVAVSSIVDTWLLVKNIEVDGERNRGLYVLKSRGMGHSNQVREFLITPHGIDLVDVYVGPGGVLTGSARAQQEAREEAARRTRERELEQRRSELERKRAALEASIEARRAEFEAEALEVERLIRQSEAVESQLDTDRKTMARMRGVPTPGKTCT
jgi:circadian clock protein KaiC